MIKVYSNDRTQAIILSSGHYTAARSRLLEGLQGKRIMKQARLHDEAFTLIANHSILCTDELGAMKL